MKTIQTSEARCRDCYKCIRHCPVKAIGLKNGQAWVSEDKCVFCGQCIKACPQNAKSTVSQVEIFDRMLREGLPVTVSIAPSYLANSIYDSPWQLIAGLYQIGVRRVEETAVAAEWVAARYSQRVKGQNQKTVISSCCPVIVDLIEKYYPQLLECLPGIASPMAVHARQIKQSDGEGMKVVFIGPCYAKKAEALKEKGLIDCVLTFQELADYLKVRNISCNALDGRFPERMSHHARLFPLHQGILHTAGIEQKLKSDIITVSGIDDCLETLEALREGTIQPRFVEALACKGGCIGGPALGNPQGIPARRERLIRWAEQAQSTFREENRVWAVDDGRRHQAAPLKLPMPTDKELAEILAQTGKYTPEDETNCGGCGYSSCREKAIAVYQGLAEVEMCIPYMKNKAESFSNVIVDTSVNGIIVVDADLVIQKYNPTAARMFHMPLHTAEGHKLETYLDPADFREVFGSQKLSVVMRSYPQWGLYTRQVIYPLSKYNVVIGIISDLTEEEAQKQKFASMKREAFDRASKVIHQQMRIAQEIAGLLGESTSDTKATLLELMEIMEGEVQ
ncbi:MAG TPA: [Fe-Fe] hydrogenase large subunit C-terminal domain-containing protein [Bacillota bacterium]|nr:[Fe-Fe] hydrogenase large subunit C-terminal domain-containing protein [Bacillota bacterium]HPT88256.1 [Fe-Fe] hydrogenase large subunit C-terminal domain-containing protein [Bacillota bacterium]